MLRTYQALLLIGLPGSGDRKSTRLNSSHSQISYAVFCLKKKIASHPSSANRSARPLMRRHRTTARRVLLLAATIGLAVGSAAAFAATVPEHIIFPVVGKVAYIDDFGALRPGGPHQGNDIMAEKKSPAVDRKSTRLNSSHSQISYAV